MFCTDRETYCELVITSRHRCSDSAEYPHRGEQQRAESQRAEQCRAGPLLPQGIGDDVLHRACVADGHSRVDGAHRRPQIAKQRPRIAVGGQHIEQSPLELSLRYPEIDLRTAVLGQVVESCLLHDADDRELILAERNLRPDWVLTWKESAREYRVYDRFVHCGLGRRLESLAGNQPHAHDLKIALSRTDQVSEDRIALRVSAVPRSARKRGSRTHALDPRHARERVSYAVLERDDPGIRDERWRSPDPNGKDTLGPETRI